MIQYDKYRFKLKEKPKYVKKKTKQLLLRMQKKKINKSIKGVALDNQIGQQKSVRADCDSKKTTFLKLIKPRKNKKQYLQVTKHAYLL